MTFLSFRVNMDETNLRNKTSDGVVFCKKGLDRITRVDSGNEKSSVTMVFSATASGFILPYMIVCRSKFL